MSFLGNNFQRCLQPADVPAASKCHGGRDRQGIGPVTVVQGLEPSASQEAFRRVTYGRTFGHTIGFHAMWNPRRVAGQVSSTNHRNNLVARNTAAVLFAIKADTLYGHGRSSCAYHAFPIFQLVTGDSLFASRHDIPKKNFLFIWPTVESK